jgi:inositol transport system substrate-binding protein
MATTLVVGLFAGCGQSTTPAATTPASSTPAQTQQTSGNNQSGEKKKIAFIATDLSLTYASWLGQSMEATVKKYPDYELTVLDSEGSLDTQMSQLENCVAQKFDYIILHPLEPDAEAATVDQIIADGIPVLMVNQSDGGSAKA